MPAGVRVSGPTGKIVSGSGIDDIPWSELETIFFDVGNTLVSIDFDWVSRELEERGIACGQAALQRAEAAARPEVSAGIVGRAAKESLETFTFYLRVVLQHLPTARDLGEERIEAVARELTPILRGPGRTQRLWSRVLPGVREALTALSEAGLQLAVVSNSDGSVESGLIDQGLRAHFCAVFDSHVVGFEKPDPRIFERALAVCGANPARTLHIGDLYAADVVGARGAGVYALLLDPFEDWGDVDCARLPDLASVSERVLPAAREAAKLAGTQGGTR
jgi:putative hydrolase of the HAD superfamily